MIADMQKSALDRFEAELGRWVRAHARQHGTASTPDMVMDVLGQRIPEEIRFAIGSGFLHGSLATTKGYYVGPPEPGKNPQYVLTVTRNPTKLSTPCWEMFVQLAEYARLHASCERRGLGLLLEYRLMDIVVKDAGGVLAYLEIKVDRADARRLVDGVGAKGASGPPTAIKRNDDAAKKVGYILRERPRYFAVRAIGFSEVYEVLYDGDRFQLRDAQCSLEALLRARTDGPVIAEHDPVDELCTSLRENCPELWASTGTGQSAFNFYVSHDGGEHIVLGVLRQWQLWTDLRPFADEQRAALASALAGVGLELATQKAWSHLRRDGKRAVLLSADVLPLSAAMRMFLDATGLADT